MSQAQVAGEPADCDPAWQAVLVERARDGDEGAFEVLVRLHQDRAYRVALRMTGRPQDAQDITQEALLSAWQGLPSFRADAQFGTWLTRIVINRCQNLRRATKPSAPLPEEDVASSAPAVEAVVIAAQRRDATLDAIMGLPFDQRAALVLRSFEGCTHSEVGRILGITENAAKARVHRARAALTSAMQEWR